MNTSDPSKRADNARETLQTNGDDVKRLELREERLVINKQPIATGEARIGKEVVSEQQSIDVPVFHEELSVRHLPVSEDAKAAAAPIGEEAEEISIPLNAERVDVQKRTVVIEKVEVGKRKVEGTEHVSDTVRHEEFRVDDDGRRSKASIPRQ